MTDKDFTLQPPPIAVAAVAARFNCSHTKAAQRLQAWAMAFYGKRGFPNDGKPPSYAQIGRILGVSHPTARAWAFEIHDFIGVAPGDSFAAFLTSVRGMNWDKSDLEVKAMREICSQMLLRRHSRTPVKVFNKMFQMRKAGKIKQARAYLVKFIAVLIRNDMVKNVQDLYLWGIDAYASMSDDKFPSLPVEVTRITT
jgi:hypothetical protein